MNGDTIAGNAKKIIAIETDMSYIKETTTKIWDKLDAQGDVRGDLDKHTDSHWKMTTLIVTIASIAVGLLTALLIKFT